MLLGADAPGRDAVSGTFLETVFSNSIDADRTVRCRLKNVNESEMRVWRYHHYRSQLDYTTKRAILMSMLRKVDAMASDSHSTTHTERTRQVSRIPPPRIPERHTALHVRDSPARDKLSTRPLRVADGSCSTVD